MARGSALAKQSSVTAEELHTKIFFDWQKALAGTPRTLAAYSQAVNRAAPYVGEVAGGRGPLVALTPGQAAEVYGRLQANFSTASANLSRAALSSLFEHARAVGVRVENPWKHLHQARARDRLAEKILSVEEVRRLVMAADDGRDRLLVRFLYATGARVSGALAVRGRDIRRLPDGAWAVTLFEKGQKTRHVRLAPQLVAEMRRTLGRYLWADEPLFGIGRKYAWEVIHRAGVRAGLANVGPHTLRHCHVSHALDAGVPLHVVRTEVGHSSLQVTDRYSHVAPGAGSVGKLPWL